METSASCEARSAPSSYSTAIVFEAAGFYLPVYVIIRLCGLI